GQPFVSVRELHQAAAPLDPRGTKASDLVKWGREYGLPVEPVRTNLTTLKRWALPAVLHVNGNHYIALVGQEEGRFVVFDNNIGLFDCSAEWFQKRYSWDGVALVVGNPPPFWVDVVSRPWVIISAALGVPLVVLVWRLKRRLLEPPPVEAVHTAANIPGA